MSKANHRALQVVKWDIRIILGVIILLAVLISLTVAAPPAPVAQFDFGTAAATDVASGYTKVAGSLTTYPTTSGSNTFGWGAGASSVQIFSNPSVADKVQRDSNGGSLPATFRISNLSPGDYSLEFTVGSLDTDIGTRIQVGSVAKIIATAAGTWKTASISATTTDGSFAIAFSGANGLTWAVNGMRVLPGTSTDQTGSFALGVSPKTQTVTAGETTSFSVGLTPLNGYADGASISVSGLVAGMAGEVTPSQFASLPGTAILRVITKTDTPPADYTLLITANGTDANHTKQSTTVNITVGSAPTNVGVGNGSGSGSTGGTGGTVQAPPEVTKTPAEMAADNKLLDDFAKTQAQTIPNNNNIGELKAINTDFGAIPSVQLPAPATPFEGFLQTLTGTGIISIAADAAPIGPKAAPSAPGFWTKLVRVIFPFAASK